MLNLTKPAYNSGKVLLHHLGCCHNSEVTSRCHVDAREVTLAQCFHNCVAVQERIIQILEAGTEIPVTCGELSQSKRNQDFGSAEVTLCSVHFRHNLLLFFSLEHPGHEGNRNGALCVTGAREGNLW